MGQGAGRPAGVPQLTVTFEEGRGQATAGSCVHGVATLQLPAPSADSSVLQCEVKHLLRQAVARALLCKLLSAAVSLADVSYILQTAKM